MPATEIIPNLWLSDIVSALDTEFITSHKISVIVNCTVKYRFIDPTDIPYEVITIRAPVRDRGTQEDMDDMLRCMNDVIPAIYEHLQDRRCVLVHCYAGRHRSVCIVLGFIIRYAKIELDQAIRLLQSKWPYVGLNFLHSLSAYQASVAYPSNVASQMDV